MNSCLDTLDQLEGWEDDLEIEELSSIQSATTIIVVIVIGWHPPVVGSKPPLTSPTYLPSSVLSSAVPVQ
jgi:hypothetical protein